MELRASMGISLTGGFVRAVTAVLVVGCAGVVLLVSSHGGSGSPTTIHRPARPAKVTVGEHGGFARNGVGLDPWYRGSDHFGFPRFADHPGARFAALTTIINESDHAIVVTRIARADDELRLVGIHLSMFHDRPGLPTPLVRPVGYPSLLVPQRLAAGAEMWLQLDFRTIGCPSTVQAGSMVDPGRTVVLFYRSGEKTFSTPINTPRLPIVCGS